MTIRRRLAASVLSSLVLAGAVVACTAKLEVAGRPCPCSDGYQCCQAQNVCVANGQRCAATPSPIAECSTAAQCIDKAGGAPAMCRADGKCVELRSEDCTEVFGQAADLKDPLTTVIGLMVPKTASGDALKRGAEIGVEDAREAIPRDSFSGAATVRGNIVVVVCDERADATRAAKHLIEDVKVPAIVGPIDLEAARQVLAPLAIPAGVAVILPLVNDPEIASLPGRQGLVWQIRGNSPATMNELIFGDFRLRYRARYPDGTATPPELGYVFDAVNVATFALVASPPGAVTGSSFARGMMRLLPPGTKLQFVPQDQRAIVATLAKGENVDVEGTSGPLDWNAAGVP